MNIIPVISTPNLSNVIMIQIIIFFIFGKFVEIFDLADTIRFDSRSKENEKVESHRTNMETLKDFGCCLKNWLNLHVLITMSQVGSEPET